jgi:ATP-dependent exoDNAse (exonuclease V) beta subunit
MTVEESKGMEYDDVLLYSPFGSSPAGSGWRVFYHQVPDNQISYPMFCSEKHNILSSELKILYTAITRARQRLWIFDPDVEAQKPMLALWDSLNLVENVETTNSSSFASLCKKSSPEAWNRKGMEFFERHQFEFALNCFRQILRLKPSEEAQTKFNLTEALHYRKQGLILLQIDPDSVDGKSKLILAGEKFMSLQKTKLAAACFEVIFVINTFNILNILNYIERS